MGSPDSPAVLFLRWDATWWRHDATGWTTGTFGGIETSPGHHFSFVTGPSMSELVGHPCPGAVGRLGPEGWSDVIGNMCDPSSPPYVPRTGAGFWTDGRYVVGGSGLCDLGERP
jgi:hypothetical protein